MAVEASDGGRDMRFTYLMFISFLLSCIVSIFYLFGFFDTPHNQISDLLQQTFIKKQKTNSVAYLLVTDSSLMEADEVDGISWPWPRSAYGEAIRYLKDAGAAAILFDMVFTEPSVHGVEDDIGFANALKQGGAIVATLSSKKRGNRSATAEQKSNQLMQRFSFNLKEPAGLTLPSMPHIRPPVTPILAAVPAIGDVKFTQDEDGVGRKVPMFIKSGSVYYPSLSLAGAMKVLNMNSAKLQGRNLIISSATGDKRVIPLDENGLARLRYYGESTIYDKYHLLSVIKSQVAVDSGEKPYYPQSLFKNKIIIIGSDATELKDLRPNPFNKTNDAGVHYHGTAIQNIIDSGFLTSWYGGWKVFPMLFLTSFLLAFASGRYSASVSFFCMALLLASLYSAGILMFVYDGVLVDFSAITVNLVGCFVFTTGLNYLLESRQRLFVTSAFGQYLSPDVVKQLVNDPSRLQLGGQNKTLTAFFSDVAGFSTISERLSPEQLVALLNDYLSEMCDIIGKHEGTVDKFEGDAIMAFWGAPMDTDRHAQLACLAAIEMQQRLAELRQEWAKQGRDQLHVRMGINSGAMVVGNMGSASRMNYTIMGDAVNLASRLEGANKFYGTLTMFTEQTYKMTTGLEVRELDLIRVMGKKEPVRIYELLGLEGQVPEKVVAAMRMFERGLDVYRQGKFTAAEKLFNDTLSEVPDDSPSLEFLRRIKNMGDNPPKGEWDGVYTADSKG